MFPLARSVALVHRREQFRPGRESLERAGGRPLHGRAFPVHRPRLPRAAAQDAIIMAAAPADFRPATVAKSKIKKESTPVMGLKLVPNPDIISEVKGDIIKVGFAAESEDLVKNATAKLKRKSLDLIVANNITEAHSGFGTDTNKVTLIDSQGKIEALPLLPKSEVAHKVLDKVVSLLNASRKNPGKPRRRK